MTTTPTKVDAQNRQGTTALMIAARRGALDLIDLLLRYKAAVNRADYTVRTGRIRAFPRKPT